MTKRIGVAVIGGTGFGAGELLRLLSQHPEVSVVSVVSASEAGQEIHKYHSFLNSFYNNRFSDSIDYKKLDSYEKSFVFLALPDAVTAAAARSVLSSSTKAHIIDLSGSFRLKNTHSHTQYYPEAELAEELRSQFVYGMPELNAATIKTARLIANPGCHVTASVLATAPLMQYKISSTVIFDSKTGTSGAGRKLAEAFHHPRMNSNSCAYKVLDHRHEPEICMALGNQDGSKFSSMFVPHLLPVSRGIVLTSYLELAEAVSTQNLFELYRDFYKNSPFIRVTDTAPELRAVVGSNFCDISVKARGKQVVAMASLDNLIKGMAGQAIQNLNLISELPETTGLLTPALGLV